LWSGAELRHAGYAFMNPKWGCLTDLAVYAVAWNVYVWTAEDPPDVGAPCILLLGLAALVVIYVGSAIERRTKKEPRGFPVEPKRPGREA
jgi:hypothetical protein